MSGWPKADWFLVIPGLAHPHSELHAMEEMNAHPIEGDEIVVEQVKQDGYNEDNLNLVAKVISDKEIMFRTTKSVLMGIWGNLKGVNISDVARNTVLISFQDFSKGFKLWMGGPWSIKGCLVNMQPWNGKKSVMEADFKKMEL
ncbi:hypothetical protein PIB30_012880 [Stylosanthes scabra]|uniref:DUF4283 domain-containing protein n=1 Tax=Stylosanthes scabra TaxID=79078 RepID=A0ABU6W7F0_9FABA|nr:hypothetical protein [Stylosanthes scabra]